MTVEHDRLQTGQQVVIAVDVRPAHLRAADHRIGEEVDQLAQAIRLRNKVGVEDREQLAFGKLVAVLERAGFETGAVVAMDVMNVETLILILRDDCFGDAHCFVSRVVEYLDLELLAWVVDRGYGFQQAVDHVQFVEEWKLDSDRGQLSLGKISAGCRHKIFVAPEVDDLLDAVRAVNGERAENGEIDEQDDPVERVELVKRADISPGFIDEIVEILLEDGLR